MKYIKKNQSNLFCETCLGKKGIRAPVWMMRQAGRYLPEYREVRKRYSFVEMYKNVDIATEVTLQPIRRFDFDAAVVFSDILIIPEAYGMDLEFIEKKGPILNPRFFNKKQINEYRNCFDTEKLQYVYDIISQVRRELPDTKAVLGFAGSPWTLASYMIEGQSSKNFQQAKQMLYSEPELLHALLELITDSIVEHCIKQVEAGADAIQIFDTWGGVLDYESYQKFSLQYVEKIFTRLRERTNTFCIYYAKGASMWLQLLRNLPVDVISVDWTLPLEQVRSILGPEMIIQGNMDPHYLYAPPEIIRSKVERDLMSHTLHKNYIANLGHGVLPDTPIDGVKVWVSTIREFSEKLYG